MSICVEYAEPSILVGVAKSQINAGNDIVVPAGIRSLDAIIPVLCPDIGLTLSEPVISYLTLESDDLPDRSVAPFNVLCNPLGGGTDAAAGVVYGLSPRYPVNLPLMGGERLRLYGTTLSTCAIDVEMAAALIFSTSPPAALQKHARVSALGAIGAGEEGIEISAGSITVTGGQRLTEVMGVCVGVGSTTVEGIHGNFRLASSGFVPNLPVKYPFIPFAGGIDIASGGAGMIDRFPIDLGLKSPSQIESFCKIYTSTMTDAAQFLAGMIYE